ncbi:MAG: protein-disulfide reductase DsbD family protein [Bdellovibrionales bacterium]
MTKDIDIFPVEPEVLSPGQPLIKKTEDSYQIQFQISATAPHAKTLSFVLVADGKAYEFTNLPVSTLSPAESTSLASLLSLLFFAFLGGTLLNLMPCVFPIIFIKAFAFLKLQDSRAKIKDGVLYTLGVLTTFTALGILFLMLKQMGMSVGWGFQLQSPLVILFLIILFWLMALNFLGVFEFGTQIMNTTGNISWRTSFGTGVLSVFIAAPCTGPFMGTALGATATLPHFQALLIFIFLGLGLAFPYFLLSLKPQLANYLPKPGPWMETIKQFFAFPLFATVLWLLWVLGQQIGTEGWFYSGLILLVISFTLWVNSKNIKVGKYFLWALTILLIGLATYQVYNTDKSNNLSHSKSKWTDYSPDKLKAALDSGQSVFIDFTAAWCITCQVNKKLVLDTPEADLIFKDANILRMRADWTNYDPQITLALKKLGRNSVPVYAFYTTGGLTPQILPQILTISNLRHLISNKEEK